MDVESAFEELLEKGFIDYGKLIPREIIEQVIGVKYTPVGWSWTGPLLQLKQYIEEQGYFCTGRKCPEGALRIMRANEMTHKVKNLDNTIKRRQKKAIHTMNHADTSALNSRELAEFNHELHKTTLQLKMMNSVLKGLL